MKNKRWLLLFIVVIMSLSVGLVACNAKEVAEYKLTLEKTVFDAEAGENFVLPTPKLISPDKKEILTARQTVSVVDADGNEVVVKNNSFKAENKKYTITYSAKYLEENIKKLVITANGADRKHPVPEITEWKMYDVSVGETCYLPSFTMKDYTGVKSSSVKVYYGDATEAMTLQDNSWVAAAGEYRVVFTAEDTLGNKGDTVYKVNATAIFADTEIEEKTLWDFNEEGYLNSAKLDFGKPLTKKIIDGSLCLSSVEADSYSARLINPAEKLAVNEVKSIDLRLQVNDAVKSVRVYDGNGDMIATLTEQQLRAFSYQNIVIRDIFAGSTYNLNELSVSYTAGANGELKIDKITYVKIFRDPELEGNTLAGFNNQDYIDSIIYSDQLNTGTISPYLGIEYISNGNLDAAIKTEANGGVVKLTNTDSGAEPACALIKFTERVYLEGLKGISFKMYLPQSFYDRTTDATKRRIDLYAIDDVDNMLTGHWLHDIDASGNLKAGWNTFVLSASDLKSSGGATNTIGYVKGFVIDFLLPGKIYLDDISKITYEEDSTLPDGYEMLFDRAGYVDDVVLCGASATDEAKPTKSFAEHIVINNTLAVAATARLKMFKSMDMQGVNALKFGFTLKNADSAFVVKLLGADGAVLSTHTYNVRGGYNVATLKNALTGKVMYLSLTLSSGNQITLNYIKQGLATDEEGIVALDAAEVIMRNTPEYLLETFDMNLNDNSFKQLISVSDENYTYKYTDKLYQGRKGVVEMTAAAVKTVENKGITIKFKKPVPLDMIEGFELGIFVDNSYLVAQKEGAALDIIVNGKVDGYNDGAELALTNSWWYKDSNGAWGGAQVAGWNTVTLLASKIYREPNKATVTSITINPAIAVQTATVALDDIRLIGQTQILPSPDELNTKELVSFKSAADLDAVTLTDSTAYTTELVTTGLGENKSAMKIVGLKGDQAGGINIPFTKAIRLADIVNISFNIFLTQEAIDACGEGAVLDIYIKGKIDGFMVNQELDLTNGWWYVHDNITQVAGWNTVTYAQSSIYKEIDKALITSITINPGVFSTPATAYIGDITALMQEGKDYTKAQDNSFITFDNASAIDKTFNLTDGNLISFVETHETKQGALKLECVKGNGIKFNLVKPVKAAELSAIEFDIYVNAADVDATSDGVIVDLAIKGKVIDDRIGQEVDLTNGWWYKKSDIGEQVAGWNHVKIPVEKLGKDITKITVTSITINPGVSSPFTIYLDNITLSGKV